MAEISEAQEKQGVVLTIPNEQRLHWKITPEPGRLMSADAVGGTLTNVGKLLRNTCEKGDPDGRKWQVAVEKIITAEDGSIEFSLVLAPVVKKKPASPLALRGGE